jgi:hypothetical protein
MVDEATDGPGPDEAGHRRGPDEVTHGHRHEHRADEVAHERASAGVAGPGSEPPGEATDEPGPTVEAAFRAKVVELFGGARGSTEAVLPFAAFTLAFVITDELHLSLGLGGAAAVALLVLRLVQRSSTQYVRHGLFAIGAGAVIALASGRAETAFLPGIVQNALWAVGLAVSMVVGRPAAGYLIGAVLGDPTGWRERPAVVRLAHRLTLVLLIPMLLRVAIQTPLYLSGEVGWLGVSRVALGWPLTAAALGVAAMMLARGQTPLHRTPGQPAHEYRSA